MSRFKRDVVVVLWGVFVLSGLAAAPAGAADMTTLTGTLAFTSAPTSAVTVCAYAVKDNPTEDNWEIGGAIPSVTTSVGATTYSLSVPSGEDYVLSAESGQFAETWGGGMHATGEPTWSQVKDGVVTASGGTVSAGTITLSMPAKTTITGRVDLGGVAASQVTVMAHQVPATWLVGSQSSWESAFVWSQPTTTSVDADGNYSLVVDSGYSYLIGAKSYYYQESFVGGYSGSNPVLAAMKSSLLPAQGYAMTAPALSLSLPGGALEVSAPTGFDAWGAQLRDVQGVHQYDCEVRLGMPLVCGGVAPGVYVASVAFNTRAFGSQLNVYEGTVVAVHQGVMTQVTMPTPAGVGTSGSDGLFGTASTSVVGLPARAGVPLTASTRLTGGSVAATAMDYYWTDGADVLGNGASFTPSGAEVGKPLSVVSVYGQNMAAWRFQLTSVGTVATGSVPANVSVGLKASTLNGRVYKLSGVPAGFTASSVAWYRSGRLVKGKTATYYRVSKKDVGKTLRAKATLTQVGFTSKRVTTPKVKMGKLSPVVTVSKLKVKRVKVKVKVYSVKKPSGVVKVKWGSKGWRTYLLTTRSKGVLKVKARAGFKHGQVKAVYQPRTKAAKKYIAKKTSKPLAVKL